MLNATSIAPAVGTSVKNVQFQTEAQNLPRKILVIGTHLASVTDLPVNAPLQVLSPEDAGYRTGFGSMLHRLVMAAFTGGQGVPVFILPQAEAGGASAAAGSVDFATSANVVAGTMYLYIANQLVRIATTAGMTAAQLATATATAITADKTLPVSAAVDGVTTSKVNLTAKSKGTWGNGISIEFNLGYGQALPAGVVAAVVDPTGGAGIPDIAAALNGLGTGDSANEAYFTDVVHGYGQDAATLTAIAAYVEGLYGDTVARPFYALTGDTAAGSTGLTNLTTLTAARKTDRANGVVAVPGSASHPSEIAAQTAGHIARIASNRVAQHYLGIALSGVHPGAKADRWTSDYDSRDTAVKSGISPTRVENGVVTLQSVVTFYRPDNVPVANNGYRSVRNIAIIQNLLFNHGLNFAQEKWQGVFIVKDTAKVTNITDRAKARDVGSVIDDHMLLARSYEGRGWIADAGFTINRLKQPGAVTVRAGGLGFDSVFPVVLSGEGGILDTEIQFDISFAALLN